jgi:hypothetical protein
MFALTLDWKSQEFYHYLAVAAAVVVALSIAVYAVPGGRLKVPGIALSIVGSLGLGLAAGIIIMGVVGYELQKPQGEGNGTPEGGGEGGGPPQGVMAGMGGGMGGMGGMAGMGGGGPGGGRGGPGGGRGGPGGFGGPNYKQQLANLVTKLDVLTEKPLTIQLSKEQRKEVKELLDGLDKQEELSDDDAEAKFKKLHEILEDQTSTLNAAGYNWPGEGGRGGPGGGRGGPGGGRGGPGGAPEPPKNPFTTEQNKKHLEALTSRLDK